MSRNLISILVCEPMAPEGLRILNNHPGFAVDVCLDLSRAQLMEKIPFYDALLVRSQTDVDQALITLGKNLKLIGRAGVGIDNIDIDFAKKQNIAVINTPLGNSISTAELAFGLMISLARKIPFAHEHVRQGKWHRSAFKGSELYQKTLGIIGFGNVGRNLAKRAKAFEMEVMAYDPMVSKSHFAECMVMDASLDQVFSQSDFLSLHCLLNDKTKQIVNERSLASMKQGAMIINTARGELIDDAALVNALDKGHIAAAGIDVFSIEPPTVDNPLIKHPKIIVTPHLGASTEEAQLRVSTQLAEYTIEYFKSRNG